jgi:Flp pilus assembly protein TadD
VLATEPKNVKALFRRGKAQLRLGNTDGAAADLDAAHRLAPNDAGIGRELRVRT